MTRAPAAREREHRLIDTDYALLTVLDEVGGFPTATISALADIRYGHDNPRQRSGAIRSWLMQLQRLGFVAPLDNQKPACWVRTPAGTEALRQRDASGG